MKRNYFAATFIATAVVVASGVHQSCTKVNYKTDYIITPIVQHVDKGPEVRRDSVVAYGLNGDTTTWKIASFEDAFNGIFTNALTQERRNADQVATFNAADTTLTLRIESEWSQVLVCNYADSIYGWRNVQIGYNMPPIGVLIKFRPWKADTVFPYDEMKWRMMSGRQMPD